MALVACLASLAVAAPAGANHVFMHAGPFGGVVVSLVAHPSAPETLYLAAFGSGVWKSVDGGHRWRVASRGLGDLSVLTLALDPTSPRTLYAGTDSGLFASTNGAGSWQRRGQALAERNIRSLAVNPGRPAVVYAATDQGLFGSEDGGATWAPRNAGLVTRDLRRVAIDPTDDRRLFAAGFGGVFRSDDEGRHWRAVNEGLADLRVRALALDPSRPGAIYAGTAGGGVFESTDGGARWRALNEGLGSPTVLSLLVTPPGERFAGTVVGVYRWEPARAAWQPVGQDVLTLTITFVVADPHRPETVYAGTGGLVFVSEDQGRRWRELAVSVANAGDTPAAAAGRDPQSERR